MKARDGKAALNDLPSDKILRIVKRGVSNDPMNFVDSFGARVMIDRENVSVSSDD